MEMWGWWSVKLCRVDRSKSMERNSLLLCRIYCSGGEFAYVNKENSGQI